MKKLILPLLLCLLLTGCAAAPVPAESADELTVIATLFPQYDFARRILGDEGTVSLILPPGTEAHSFEPTPQDIAAISDAGLLFYTSAEMEPWVEKLSQSIENAQCVDMSAGITLSDADPHYWTDPTLAAHMADNILAALSEAAPEHAALFAERTEALKAELAALDAEIAAGLAPLEDRTVFYGGHFALNYFAQRYQLAFRSPYEGYSPDAEPSPRQIAALSDALAEAEHKCVFYEELENTRAAETIAAAAGAELLPLSSVHNVSAEDMAEGKTYIDFMRENLKNLKSGLGIDE